MSKFFDEEWEQPTRDTVQFLNNEFNSSRIVWTLTEISRFKSLLSQFINSNREILSFWHSVRLSGVYAQTNELALRAALLKAHVAQTPDEAFGIIESFLTVYPQECRLLETGLNLAAKFGYDGSRYYNAIIALNINTVPNYYKEFVTYYQNQSILAGMPYLMNYQLPPDAYAVPNQGQSFNIPDSSQSEENNLTQSLASDQKEDESNSNKRGETEAKSQLGAEEEEEKSEPSLPNKFSKQPDGSESNVLTWSRRSEEAAKRHSKPTDPKQQAKPLLRQNGAKEEKKSPSTYMNGFKPKKGFTKRDASAKLTGPPHSEKYSHSSVKKKTEVPKQDEWTVTQSRRKKGPSNLDSSASVQNHSVPEIEEKQGSLEKSSGSIRKSVPIKVSLAENKIEEKEEVTSSTSSFKDQAKKKIPKPLVASEIIRGLQCDPSLDLIQAANLLLQNLNERKKNSNPPLSEQDLIDQYSLMASISAVPSLISNVSDKDQIKLLRKAILGAFERNDLSNFTKYLSRLIILKSSDLAYQFDEHIKQLEKLIAKKEDQKNIIFREISKIAQVFMEQGLYPQAMSLYETSDRILETGSENWKENEAKIDRISRIFLYATNDDSLKVQDAVTLIREIHSNFTQGSRPSKSKLNSFADKAAALFQLGWRKHGLFGSVLTSTVSALLAFKTPNAHSRKLAEDYYEHLIDEFQSSSNLVNLELQELDPVILNKLALDTQRFYLTALDASIHEQDSIRKFYRDQTRKRLRNLNQETFTMERTRASISKSIDDAISRSTSTSSPNEATSQLDHENDEISKNSFLTFIEKNRFVHDLILRVTISMQMHLVSQTPESLKWISDNYGDYKAIEKTEPKSEESFEYLLSSIRHYLYNRASGNTSKDAETEKIKAFVEKKAFLLKLSDRTPVELETLRRLKLLYEKSQKYELIVKEDGKAIIRHF